MTGFLTSFRARGGGYVVVQFLLLALIAVQGGRAASSSWRVWAFLLVLAGLFVMLSSFITLGRNLTALPEPVPHGTLVTRGVYGVVRHPIYSAILLLCLGLSVQRGSLSTLLLTLALTVLFHFKSEFEERALRRRFPEYAAYQARTKKFIPGVL